MANPTIENICFVALHFGTKCMALSHQNLVPIILTLTIIWFFMAVIFWAHPGGHAWGKFYFMKYKFNKTNSIIPGPRGIPFMGCMKVMSSNIAHVQLYSLAESLGAQRLMAFSLGETRVVVTCNPDVAKEILQSSVFVDRPKKESADYLMFNRAMGFAPYGDHWRLLRRIASTHLFCQKLLKVSETQRFEIANQMLIVIEQFDGCPFQVRNIIKRASLNNMVSLVLGLQYNQCLASEHDDDEVKELGGLVEEGYDLLGQLNWSDHFPLLAGFDLQKIRFRCSKLLPKVNRFVGRIIAERKGQLERGESKHDFVEVLLSINEPDVLSDHNIIAVLWEMIFRGTDTVAVLIEWFLARMVLHPEIQSKIQKEIDQVIGNTSHIKETDISSMVYLQAVVKEVLRLHPPGPLLSWARKSISDTTIDGHHIPAGTTAMVNMWAICREPQFWPDPLKFKPDRFTVEDCATEFSIMGSDLRLAPFGSGRRICPGKTLGLTTVTYWAAILMHKYEWMAAEKNSVELSECLRLSCEMVNPLIVRALPRLIEN